MDNTNSSKSRTISRIRLTLALALVVLSMFLLSTCDQLLEAGLGERVDIDAPVLEILSHENGNYVTGLAQIGGTFGDDSEVLDLALSIDGGESFTSIDFDDSIEEWSHDLDTTAFIDGEKDIRVKVTDAAQKSAEKRLLLYFDNNTPVVLIKNPSGYASAEFNDDITVRGEASDTSGIAIVEIELFDGSGTAVPLYDSEGNVTTSNITTVDGTNSWSFQFQSRYYTLASGTYSFVVTSTDRAGNTNTYVYHDDDIRTLSGGPAVTVESLYTLDKGIDIEGVDITLEQLASARLERLDMSVDQSLDIPVIDFSAPTVANNSLGEGANAIGTVRDDDGIDVSSIMIRFDSSDDADWIPVTTTTGVGISISWEHDLSALAQGVHTVELSVSDINGLAAASAPLSFLIDSGAPQVTIDAPLAGDYLNNDFIISGTASDAVGVGSVEIRIGDAGSYMPVTTFDPSVWTPTVDTNVWTWSHSFVVEPDLSTEGTQQFRIRATDTSGKESAENLQVFVDSVLPVVTFLGISSGEVVNGSILLQGTTQNVSPIDQISLDVDTGTSVYLLDSAVNELDTDPTSGAASTVFRWYKTIDTTAYSDGALPIIMTAVDAAGNSGGTTLTLTVDQSTDIPTILFDNVDAAGTANDNAFFGSASLIGRVTDDDGVNPSTVEVRIDGGVWEPVSTASGSGFSITWEHILSSVAEGVHTAEIRVDDVNSISAASTAVNFLVDNGAPAVSITDIVVGTRTISSNFQGAYVNGPFTISGTATDGFGVDTVDIEINQSGTFEGVTELSRTFSGTVETVTWEYDVATGAMSDGTVSLRIRSLDHTGKSANSDIELVLDTIDPSVEYILPVAGDTVNGTLTISGTASDTNKVDEVYLAITDAGAEPPVDVSVVGGWLLLSQLYSWNEAIDTRLLTDSQNHTAHVVAIDAAGNRSDGLDSSLALERSFFVDQSTDKPVATFDGVSGVAAENLFT